MAAKTAAVSKYTQKGKAPAAFMVFGRLAAEGDFPAEYPQTGQPSLKRAASPIKPQAGQLTDAKYLPHFGQFFASLGTSIPQVSQKKRGDFPAVLGIFQYIDQLLTAFGQAGVSDLLQPGQGAFPVPEVLVSVVLEPSPAGLPGFPFLSVE